MRAASIARMPRVIPPKSGTRGIEASENGGEHDGEKKELKEVTALQVWPSIEDVNCNLSSPKPPALLFPPSFHSNLRCWASCCELCEACENHGPICISSDAAMMLLLLRNTF